jgi:thiol:disulfide interchange protein
MRSESLLRVAVLIVAVGLAACGGSSVTEPKEPQPAASLDDAKLQAASSGRPILVDVYADW